MSDTKAPIEDFARWIGRTDALHSDIITPRLNASFRATLDPHLAPSDTTPPGLHWCLTPSIVAADQLGLDGHPKKGGFLPPIPLPRRMWAGGQVEFISPLNVGETVEKKTTIKDIKWKTGASGQLCFVTVSHDYSTLRGLCIREDQNIVYRSAANETGPSFTPKPFDKKFECSEAAVIDQVRLFRYSALTFNGHRIHYDHPYATAIEFYPDLVIHGPLQATLLLNLATKMRGSIPRRFSFRGAAPATGAQTLTIGGQETDDGIALSIVTEQGYQSMSGQAKW